MVRVDWSESLTDRFSSCPPNHIHPMPNQNTQRKNVKMKTETWKNNKIWIISNNDTPQMS